MKEQWKGFKGGNWCNRVDVKDFIQNNYTPYEGDESFLEGTTAKTDKVWEKCSCLLKEELKNYYMTFLSFLEWEVLIILLLVKLKSLVDINSKYHK